MTGSPQLQLLDGTRWGERPITGERQQLLLAALTEAGGPGLSASRLATEVWPEDPPVDPVRSLQVVVSRTRSMTDSETVVRTEAGYRLGLSPDRIDHLCLRTAVEEARRAAAEGDWTAVLARAELARSVPVSDRDTSDALGRLAAQARRLQAEARDLAGRALSRLGRHEAAVPLLRRAVADHAEDESLLEPLLRSLAATAGAAAALERYEEYRTGLASRLGTDPGPGLQRLYGELLAADRPVREGIRYDATKLIGREEDLAALRALMATGRVTTILGPGGLGKTRLAHVLARTDTHPVVHFVELVGVSAAEDLIGEVGSALGVRDSVIERRTLTPEQRADVRARMVQRLDTAPTLLVLDNCEHLVDAVADLVAYLVAGTRDLHVVTTSRAPLGIAAERVYQLGQLGTAEGVELFTQRARAARPSATVPAAAAADLVTRLDGLPLAIELAAAKIRVMSVPEILRRLEDRFTLLRGGDRSAPDRHQTLLAVIDWSWNLLAEPQRAALCRLSLFHDGFTLATAEQILPSSPGPGTTDVVGMVQDLVDQSLLTVHEEQGRVRYRMLETVREFGRMRLVDSGAEDEAVAAQRDWAIGYAAGGLDDLFGPAQFDAVAALREEEANLADVLRRAIAASDAGTVARVFATLAAYWSILGDHARVIVVAEAVGEVLSVWSPPPELEGSARAALTMLINNLMIGAASAAERPRAILRRLGPGEEPRLAGITTVLLAVERSDAEGATTPLAELAEGSNRYQALVALQLLSHVQENAGDPAAAVEAASRALALTEPEDGPWQAAILRTQLAQLHMQLGNTGTGVEHAREALPVLERLGANDDAVQLHSLLACAAIGAGDLAEAEAEILLIDQLEDEERAFGGQLAVAMCRAELLLARGEHEEGVRYYLRAVERVRGLRYPGMEASGLEPWVILTEAVALTACAYYAADGVLDEAASLEASCLHRLDGVLGPNYPYLDYPVCGLAFFALGAWRLLRGVGDPAHATRLLALAERFAYTRPIPTMSWDRMAAAAERIAPGMLASSLAAYGDRRGPDLLDEARAVALA